MAEPLGELFVKVGADTKGLKRGLKGAEKQVGSFSKSIQKHSRAIGMAMTALGGAILAMGFLSVKTFAKMGDEVQKMALRTGFSTEALSELRHAAELSGTSLSSLEKASKTLSGAILDAGFGLETYVRAFDKIGLSYERLKPLSPEEQFLAVMEALAGLTDESEKAALAADLFGRAGTQLLPMLADGAEGLARMRQEAHDLGIVFDQEAADKAAAFNDALTKLKGSVTGVMMEIGSLLVDALKPLIDDFVEIIKGVGEWTKEHPELTKVIVLTTLAVGGLLAVLGPLVLIGGPIITALAAIRTFLLASLIPTIIRTTAAFIAMLASMGPAGWAAILVGGTAAAVGIAMMTDVLGGRNAPLGAAPTEAAPKGKQWYQFQTREDEPILIPQTSYTGIKPGESMPRSATTEVNINIENLVGDEESTSRLARKVKEVLAREARRTTFPPLNELGYYPGSSAP